MEKTAYEIFINEDTIENIASITALPHAAILKSIVGPEGESWSSMLIMTKKAKEKFKQAIEEGKKFRQVIKETTKYMLLKGDINQDIVSQATLSDAEIKSLKGVIVMKEKGKSTQKNFHKK
jgi:outer membrane protease